MKTNLLWRIPTVFMLLGLTACPNTDPDPVPASTPNITRELPASEAVAMTVDPANGTFCCDPNKPFPQVIGTITFTNRNRNADTSPIRVNVNTGAGQSLSVDADPNVFDLASGATQTVTVYAEDCDWTTDEVPIEFGYHQEELTESVTLTVNNACPTTAAVRTALTVLCQPTSIDPLFYPTYVIAAVAVLITHSSVLVPAALITHFYTEITGYGGFPVFLSALKLAAAFSYTSDGVSFPPGQGPNGYTIYPDRMVNMQEGDYLVVHQVLQEDVPLADPTFSHQYGFVFDADGDIMNNYAGQNPFLNDFFNDTDRWYAVTYDPQNGWHLRVTDARQGAGLLEVDSAARVIISGNAVILVVPASEFAVAKPKYRVTSFTHTGDFGLNPPHVWSGDPTPPVHQPLAEIE